MQHNAVHCLQAYGSALRTDNRLCQGIRRVLAVTAQGFLIGLGLVSPVGMQNTWVLNQGIRRNHHLLVAFVCGGCDVLLIGLGVTAHSMFQTVGGQLAAVLTNGAIVFLIGYSIYLMYGALRRSLGGVDGAPIRSTQQHSRGVWIVVLGTLLVTLLNPHVLAERIVIFGAISAEVAVDARVAFASGAIAASFVWFLCLSSAAAKLHSILSRPGVRVGLDLVVAIVLTGLAAYLLLRI
ncbi:MAG: LysE family transporter [Gammaproteobacteria bacterium]|nr:LysE family transporter [Gammaproteobacteria bacterium]